MSSLGRAPSRRPEQTRSACGTRRLAGKRTAGVRPRDHARTGCRDGAATDVLVDLGDGHSRHMRRSLALRGWARDGEGKVRKAAHRSGRAASESTIRGCAGAG
ncbi:hypothetical protein [Rhizohabitans arisaemae]|uniref:hypothetical protein n=1 Tax=Rhizohabitans arisaemae TaxID=2720610 RepID=UPI0024B1ADA4|nr:hypothetical protein [Rhizohabitans arisaemae]